ncbi:hypothetical protein [Streptomyces sp. C10-9-1]|uniref:hypothetical protein n=1 Tax=Streptomyces sp. C10-9-1 TaxID=1859285 RepID=UPI003F4A28D3
MRSAAVEDEPPVRDRCGQLDAVGVVGDQPAPSAVVSGGRASQDGVVAVARGVGGGGALVAVPAADLPGSCRDQEVDQ